jgi:hypothetical protein
MLSGEITSFAGDRHAGQKPQISREHTQQTSGLWKRLWPAEFEERGDDTS